MWREEVVIELYVFDNINGCFIVVVFFDGDYVIFVDFEEGFCEYFIDCWIVVFCDCCDLIDFFFVFGIDFCCLFIDFGCDDFNCLGNFVG